MATYLYEPLPTPIVASVGAVSSLSNILGLEFGSNLLFSKRGYSVFYNGANSLVRENDGSQGWGYWDASHPVDTSWSINGVDVGQGPPGHYVTSADPISLHVGNSIGSYASFAITISDPSVPFANAVNVWYSVNIVDPSLISTTAANGAPTPSDVVAAAQRIAAAYTGTYAETDCWNIACDVAAAAGATLPVRSGSVDPTQNVDGGFWRVVYRGSDPNPVANWQTLVQPGDIVRMQWQNGTALVGNIPQHSTTVMAKNPDGSITVVDNPLGSDGQGRIGVHTVNYDRFTVPTSVTIYRLSPDHLYLIDRTDNSEVISGSTFNDAILAHGGNDSVAGGIGADVVLGNQGDDILLGQQGNDVLVGGQGNDIVVGGNDADLLFGNESDDILLGNEANDTIFAGQGNDLVFGGQGDDLIYGNQGNDTLLGNEGADRFIFSSGDAADLIRGFNAAEGDRILLGGLSYSVAQAANGNAIISVSGGGTIELEGIAASAVGPGLFG